MTKDERKDNSLIRATENFNKEVDEVVDQIYKLIDKECNKTDVSFKMSKFKQKLKRLEIVLKTY